MEWYGKILCISASDLTTGAGAVMSESCYKQLAHRGRLTVVRRGVGRGVSALVAVESLPDRYKDMVKQRYGTMEADVLRRWLSDHWEIDQAAQSWYSTYRTDEGYPLTDAQQQEYTLNASVLQTVCRLLDDTRMKRAVMQGGCVRWDEMTTAIAFYREEFGHTLPESAARFKRKVYDFRSKGYETLISAKIGNQNKRKVNERTVRLVLSLAARPNKPWIDEVWDMYNEFVNGRLTVYSPETGEVMNPADFRDKNGHPVELSRSTIRGILTQPKNQVLLRSAQMSWSTFMHKERPHVHRHSPEFSFSKISFDDRDLPRKLRDTRLRPKAYYAYDVASQCVVGVAYNRQKNVDLVVEMFRSMFRLIERRGWGCPAQVEVENHLMSQWRDSFLKAGEVFPFVRFCAPLNSQEKRSEHFNGAKKRSIEHRNHLGIGRFYARNEAYRTESRKVSDATNDTYEDSAYYSWEQLIADDMADVREFNNSLHPNQKKYPGMTRWQVLEQNMNPTLQPVDRAKVCRHIGEHVTTSIRRNSYCRVAYRDYWLSSPDVLERLEPGNLEVDAYYLPDDDGNTGDVYIYQHDRLIDTLRDVGTFNEAAAEQTDRDTDVMTEQLKLISRFDAMMKREAITPAGVMREEVTELIARAEAKEVPEDDTGGGYDDDFLHYDTSRYRHSGRQSL